MVSTDIENNYLAYHEDRFKFLVEVCNSVIHRATLLEIAPCKFTYYIRARSATTTLGFKSGLLPYDELGRHIEYDLNNISSKATWPELPQYQLVIACEIIEHLTVNMGQVYRFLANYIRPGGYLIIQTPNAVALKKRVSMMIGNNPFDLMWDDDTEHKHIREYTMNELTTFGRHAGLTVEKKWCKNYFLYNSPKAKLYKAICNILPLGFQDGITILYSKVCSV